MMIDLLTGTPREVDVLMTGNVGGYELYVSIECRDHKRPQGVGWVQEMQAKHRELKTNALVLVSSSGFTKEAQVKAASYDIELVVPGEAEQVAARRVVGKLNALWYKQVELTATSIRVDIDEGDLRALALVRPGGIDSSGIDAGQAPIYDGDGNECGTLLDMVSKLLNGLDVNDLLRDATGGENGFTVVVPEPVLTHEEDGVSSSPYLSDTTDGVATRLRIVSVEISGIAKVGVAEVSLAHTNIRGTDASYGAAAIGDSELVLVVTESSDTDPNVSIKVSPTKRFSGRTLARPPDQSG